MLEESMKSIILIKLHSNNNILWNCSVHNVVNITKFAQYKNNKIYIEDMEFMTFKLTKWFLIKCLN